MGTGNMLRKMGNSTLSISLILSVKFVKIMFFPPYLRREIPRFLLVTNLVLLTSWPERSHKANINI